MPPEVLAGLRRLLPGLSVQLMFGLTECKRAAIMPPDADLRRPAPAGGRYQAPRSSQSTPQGGVSHRASAASWWYAART